MSFYGFWMGLQIIMSSKKMAFISGMSGKQKLEIWARSMVFNGGIGLITTMGNTSIKSIKSLSKFGAILHQEESLSALGMLQTCLMKAFPHKRMPKQERWHWHHVMHSFNFLFRRENCLASSIKEVAIHF